MKITKIINNKKRVICPQCGSKLNCIISLCDKENGNHKKRKCCDCGHVFNTVKKKNGKIIAVDFDGTLCSNAWPNIGIPNNKLINYLKKEKTKGSKIILWTCRTDEQLEQAIRWCTVQGLEFDAINDNVPEAVKWFGGDSRKVYADEYIDDKNSTKFLLPFNKKGS